MNAVNEQAAQMAALMKRIAALERAASRTPTALTAAQADIVTLDGRVDTLEATDLTLDSRLDTLEGLRSPTTYTANPRFGSWATNLVLNRAEYWLLGNGLVAGYVDVELSGAPGAGAFNIAMPFPEMADHNTGQPIGQAMLLDQNTARYLYMVYASPDDARAYIVEPRLGALQHVTNTSPFTFASTDGITINFQYRYTV